MTSTQKIKLDGIEAGANKTIIDATLSDTSTNAVQNKVLKRAIDDIESVAMTAADDISVIQDDISAIQNDYYNSKNLVALTDTELNEILK